MNLENEFSYVIIQTDKGYVSGSDSRKGLLFNKVSHKPYYLNKNSAFIEWLKSDIEELISSNIDFNILNPYTLKIVNLDDILNRGFKCTD